MNLTIMKNKVTPSKDFWRGKKAGIPNFNFKEDVDKKKGMKKGLQNFNF